MEKYNNIFNELRALFPHANDIRIEVDTNEVDMGQFSNSIKEGSKSSFSIVSGDIPELHVYSALRTPLGMIKLNKHDNKTS